MSGLERFGFQLPEQRTRGKTRVGKAWKEVHRNGFAGDMGYDIITRAPDGKVRKDRVDEENVRELWHAIHEVISGYGDLSEEQKLAPEPVLTARQIMRRLWERIPTGDYHKQFDVSAWQGGENRSMLYFPRYYYPLLVLDLYYGIIERSGRNVKVTRAFSLRGPPEAGPMDLGADTI